MLTHLILRAARCRFASTFSFLLAVWFVIPIHAFAQPTRRTISVLPNWQYGLFAAGGYAPNYQVTSGAFRLPNGNGNLDYLTENIKLDFWNAGFLGGRMLTALHGPGILRGRTEAMLEIMPFWMARYPRQSVTATDIYGNGGTNPDYGPLDKYGASITPFLIRYNFQHHPDSRVLPWMQLGGGLLWTNHKFPYGVAGSTSVINFTPQGGVGVSTFLRRHQSVDLAMKVVQITSAGLGDYNPGIEYSFQFAAGYSWWK